MTQANSTEEILSLTEATRTIEQLRTVRLLFAPLSEGMNPKAEQHYLLALSCLEQAQRHMALAAIEQGPAQTLPRFIERSASPPHPALFNTKV